jgi:flavin reductase (DIM6/NTAB) family NADH-FMN oxidoreductase RutF
LIIDAGRLDAESGYKLLIGTIVPRAIGWVSTLSPTGVANLAPISFFTAVGRKPPMVSLSMQPRSDGTLKDTLTNIRDTGEFATNLVTLPNAHHAHRSAFEFPPDVDEFDALGIEKAACEVIRAPRVASAPVAFECTLERMIPVGDTDYVVWGVVQRFHIADEVYLERDGGARVDTVALPVIGRLAAEYTLVSNTFTTPLDDGLTVAHTGRRMRRLDGLDDDFAAVDQASWSPSGSVT